VERRAFIVGMPLGLLAAPLAGAAQQAGKTYRIGVLSAARLVILDPLLDAFRERLQELGYIEPQTVFYVRAGSGRVEDIPRLVGELISLKVDVLVIAASTQAALAAKRATREIPIVAVAVGEPVRTGLVPSIARPGGNITGSTVLGTEVASKRLQLATELRPASTQIALLTNPDNPAIVEIERELTKVAARQKLTLVSIAARSPAELEVAFGAIAKKPPGVLLVTADATHQAHIDRVIAFAARLRIPAIYNVKANAQDGGLLAYAPDDRELYRRAADYVDKILRGTKPGDLPFQQATKFELVINLKTAKALGLTIPPSLLARADEIVE